MPKKLLLVEDNAMLQRIVVSLFENEGYEVAAVDDFPSGLQALEHGPFDLVITDKEMKDDTNAGLKMAEAARAAGDMPIILMSAGVSAAARPLVEKTLKRIGGHIQFFDKMDPDFSKAMISIAQDGPTPPSAAR